MRRKHAGFLPAITLIVSLTAAGFSSETVMPRNSEANPWTHLRFNDNPDHFQFAIMSDRTGGHRDSVFRHAVTKLNLLQPEFVICIGDLIEGYTEDQGKIARQWQDFDDIVGQLEMPFFYVPGNHDLTTPIMRDIWRQRRGRSYYHFVYKDVLFLCLNSEDGKPGQITQEQVDYFSDVLAKDKSRWTLVFLHKPLWLGKENKGWEDFEALLRNRKYTVFSGHYHTYMKHEIGGRRHFVLGTTGGASELKGPSFGQFDHVVWATMTETGPRIANLMLDGIVAEDVRTPETAVLVDRFLREDAFDMAPLFITQPYFNGTTVQCRVTNPADFPMTMNGAFVPAAHVRPEPNTLSFVLPAASERKQQLQIHADTPIRIQDILPIELDWNVSYDRPGHAPVQTSGRQHAVIQRLLPCVPCETPIIVDGRLDEWRDLPFVCREPAEIRLEAETWKDSEDCSFRFSVKHDNNALYLAIETTDDRLVVNPAKPPWRQDGVEIRLDARPDPERSRGRGTGELRDFLLVALVPVESEDTPSLFNSSAMPEGLQAVCRKTATGHVTEMCVPVEYLNGKQGKPWERVRLNICVDDLDYSVDDLQDAYSDDRAEPGNAVAQIWWRPDWRHDLTYAGSGTFQRITNKE